MMERPPALEGRPSTLSCMAIGSGEPGLVLGLVAKASAMPRTPLGQLHSPVPPCLPLLLASSVPDMGLWDSAAQAWSSPSTQPNPPY